MENIIGNNLNLVSLSHCIVQAARPRTVILPIQFDVGVSLDHVFGSKWLVNFVARLGLCITSDESNSFKQFVVQCGTDDNLPTYCNCFTQWSADNVVYNINTVDGQGSFHGMGVISMSTPYVHGQSLNGAYHECPVIRLQRQKVSTVVRNKGIPTLAYCHPDKPT